MAGREGTWTRQKSMPFIHEGSLSDKLKEEVNETTGQAKFSAEMSVKPLFVEQFKLHTL